jgi:hypothetical protein
VSDFTLFPSLVEVPLPEHPTEAKQTAAITRSDKILNAFAFIALGF